MTPQDFSKYGMEIVKVKTPAGKLQGPSGVVTDTPEKIEYKLYERGDSGSSAGFRDIQGFDPSQYQGMNIREFSNTWDTAQYGNDWKADKNYFEVENLARQGYGGANTSKANIHASQLGDIFNQYAARAQNAETAARIGREIEERNKIAMQNYKPSDPTRALEIQAQNKALAGMTNEQIYAQGAALYPELAKQNPYNNTTPTFQTATGYTVPNVIPQAKVEGQYLYASDVLDKKANNAAVNALYNAYFNRNATAAELKNWGWDEKTQTGGGKDTTVRTLEDFLKQERIKYGVKDPIGELGQIKQVKITPTKGTTETIGSGKTGSDVARAVEENIASAPKAGEKTTIGKLEAFLANQEALAKQVQGFMQPSEAEKSLKSAYVDETARISGQPIQMAFIRGQQAVQDRKYQAQLALLQGDRQAKLDAAKFLYDANRNTLSDTINLYKATAPENIGTHIDEATGTMYVVTKNPLTGEVSTMNAGNVGAGKKYTSTSIQTDPVTNQMLFVGVKPDGSIETKALTQGGEKPLSSADRLKYAQDIVANSGNTVTMEEALKQIDQAQGNVGTSATAGVSRTDRNNNPTAMTTDVARTLGLVEGVDYVQGDPFQTKSGTLYTAKLSGDPFQTTIRALDNAASSGDKQAFYTQAGAPRWSHTAMTDQQWTAMSPQQKLATVQQMYQRENGTGGSLGAGAPATAPSGQTFDQYLQMKQEEAGQSFATQKVEQLRKEFEGAATKATEIVTGLRTAASNLTYSLPTEAAKKQLVGEVNKLIAKGDYKGAENKLRTVAVSTMKGDEKSEYNISKTVSVGMNDVQQKINQLKTDGATAGVYKNALESAKPYANISKDQRWVSLVSDIQGTQAKYRNQLFGASLTDNELAMSNSFLIDPTQDSLSTMITKANGLKTLAESVSKRLVNQKLGIEEEERPALDSFVVSETQSSINPKFIR